MKIVESNVNLETVARMLNKDLEGGGYDVVMQYIRMDNDRDPYDDTEIPDEDALVAAWCEEKVAQEYRNLQWMFQQNGGKLKVWREITAPEDWKIDSRHPGIFWSWDKAAAEAHWGDFGNNHVRWLIEAIVAVNDVDWPHTIVQNANPDYSDECEIRLIPNRPINIISYWQD